MSPSDSPPARILVVDDDESMLELLTQVLTRSGYLVETAKDVESCWRKLGEHLIDAALLDVHLYNACGLSLLKEIQAKQGHIPVVMLSADSAVDTVVRAVQEGAFDYLTKPIDRNKLTTTMRNALNQHRMNNRLRELEREAGEHPYEGLLGRSAPMNTLFRKLDRLTAVDVTVLVRGESGTGKELIARALHNSSPRSKKPFVAINCAAIPESLQESELFGHEKGSFTGASVRRIGRFEQAQGGTLFLDEVGELSLPLQAKLLRVLQERTFYRIGGDRQINLDVRIVSATHKDLDAACQEGLFRSDLYFRIGVFELWVPPLRDREGDVSFLSAHFLRELAPKYGHHRLRVSREAQDCLARYHWPGNVRELRNAMERALVLCTESELTLEHLPRKLTHPSIERFPEAQYQDSSSVPHHTWSDTPSPPVIFENYSQPPPPTLSMEEVERRTIEAALQSSRGNVSEVIRKLGIPRTTLYRKLKYYGLRK